jgi:hypothetical protein
MFKTTYSNKIIKLSLLFFGLFFLPGCFHGDKQKKSQEQGEVIKKAPTSARKIFSDNNTAEKYQECRQRGYSIVKKFDQQTEKTRTYCKFNGTACLLDKFISGQCGPGKGDIKLEENKKPGRPINCKEYNPVCGENDHTYANRCLAQRTEVNIAHEGYCSNKVAVDLSEKKKQQNSNNSKVRPNNNQQTSNQNNNEGNQDNQQKIPNWVDIVISLSKSDNQAYIKRCNLKEKTFYYQKLNSEIDTVYNQQGNIICNPSRDFNNTCPKNLDLSSNKCRTILSS